MLSEVRAIVDRHRRPVLLAGWLVGIVVTVAGGYVALSRFTTLSVGQRLTATGILANGVLTFGLLWVYTEMADVQTRQVEVQEQQTDILNQQEVWMEANHAPKLVGEVSPIKGQDNTVCLRIENRGNGLASNIGLKIEVRRPLDQSILMLTGDEPTFHRFDPEEDIWTPPDFTDISAETEMSGPQNTALPSGSDGLVIGPDEQRDVWIEISFTGFHDSSRTSISPLSMRQLFNELDNKKFDNASMSLRLSYQNIAGEVHEEQILDGVVKVERGKTVREAVSELLPSASKSKTNGSDGG